MQKRYQLALHIFRRDLRIHDNTALITALSEAKQVIASFIFDQRQIEKNEFKSENALQFMQQSLAELAELIHGKNGKLYFFYGTAEGIVTKLLSDLPIEAVYINRDYTPFSKLRDDQIAKVCCQNRADFHVYADALLTEPEQILKGNNQPYTIFTPFYKKSIQYTPNLPQKNPYENYYIKKIASAIPFYKIVKHTNCHLHVKGGRKEAIALLNKIPNLISYAKDRNYPAKNGTTYLSAHHKFGTISIRETYKKIHNTFGVHHDLIKELFWRDFFTHIAFHFSHVFQGAFHQKYNYLPWETSHKNFCLWCKGQTGFPIIDAGMRELNTTGSLHNRVRMITASFLVKDLFINWRWGEKYFAQQLIDYDPSINNGNWQWVASTGCDAQPFFRIFNPWLQQKKFDPDCLYIKRWIPELSHLSSKQIHELGSKNFSVTNDYSHPIVNHTQAAQHTRKYYKEIARLKK